MTRGRHRDLIHVRARSGASRVLLRLRRTRRIRQAVDDEAIEVTTANGSAQMQRGPQVSPRLGLFELTRDGEDGGVSTVPADQLDTEGLTLGGEARRNARGRMSADVEGCGKHPVGDRRPERLLAAHLAPVPELRR